MEAQLNITLTPVEIKAALINAVLRKVELGISWTDDDVEIVVLGLQGAELTIKPGSGKAKALTTSNQLAYYEATRNNYGNSVVVPRASKDDDDLLF